MGGEVGQIVVGEDVAGRQEVLRAERVFRGENVHLAGGGGAQNGHGLRDHLGADAVASDHGDVKGVTHAGSPTDCQVAPRKAGNCPKTPASAGPVSLPLGPLRRFCPPFGGPRFGRLGLMSIGLGIFLIVVGAIFAFALQVQVDWIDLQLVGYICLIAGVLVTILGIVLLVRRRQSVTTSRTSIDPVAGERVDSTVSEKDPLQ